MCKAPPWQKAFTPIAPPLCKAAALRHTKLKKQRHQAQVNFPSKQATTAKTPLVLIRIPFEHQNATYTLESFLEVQFHIPCHLQEPSTPPSHRAAITRVWCEKVVSGVDGTIPQRWFIWQWTPIQRTSSGLCHLITLKPLWTLDDLSTSPMLKSYMKSFFHPMSSRSRSRESR